MSTARSIPSSLLRELCSRVLTLCVLALAGACGGGPSAPSLVREAPHDYFEQVSARPDRLYAYSLRDQVQLDQFVFGQPPSPDITYNPQGDAYPRKQDAAKVTIEADRASIARQVRLPINASVGSALITWDAWWGPEFQSDLGGMRNHKTFQIASPLDTSQRWLEVRSRYSEAVGGICLVDARPYAVLGPATRLGSDDRLEPMRGEFTVAPATWTRYWVLVEFDAGTWDRVSLWIADENRAPVQLLDRVEMRSAGGVTNLWLEFNSSQRRSGGPLVAYVRNVVVLGNVTNPSNLFRRPVGD
ncbi:MAG: hypothetical protein AB7G23_07530 [Vicinamibacterales bacterium]